MVRAIRSSVALQSTALTIALLLLAAATIAFAIQYNLRSSVLHDAETDAREAIRAMAVLSELSMENLDATFADDHVQAVTIAEMPEMASHDLVDRVARSIAGVATVFAARGSDYVRISTNVKKEDGSRAVGTTLAPDHPAQGPLASGEAYFGPAKLFGRDFMTGYYPTKNAAGANTGILFIGIPMEVYYAKIDAMLRLVAGVGLACMVLFGALAFFGMRAMIRPLAILTASVRKLAAGDLATEAPYTKRPDEFGDIGRALAVFKENALQKQQVEAESAEQRSAAEQERARNDAERSRTEAEIAEAVDLLAHALERLADGDLTHRIATPFSGRLEKVRTDFNTSLDQLAQAMREIHESVHAIRSGAGEIRTASDDMSRRVERQAASVEETAAALEEITATVRDASRRAEEAGALVTRTRSSAETSGDLVQRAVEAMQLIDKSSREISQIIGVIDEIAFQTNLLALNAGVEAARAGEAGKGFAVVAQEVRALAQRSAEAAKEIKELISTSAGQVRSGVDLVGKTGASLGTIVAEVKDIHEHVEAIVASAREQATSLGEINTAVTTIDQATQQNAAMAEQSAAASDSLSREANALNALVARFELDQAGGESGKVASLASPLHATARAMRHAASS